MIFFYSRRGRIAFSSIVKLVLVLIGTGSAVCQAKPVNISAEGITWTVETDTMQVSARKGTLTAVEISLGISDHTSSTVETTSTVGNVGWAWPGESLHYECSAIAGGGLQVVIGSGKPQKLAWPRINVGSQGAKVVWPLGQGVLFDAADSFWQREIFGREWDAVEALTLPVCGVLQDENTVSFMSLDPFRNTIRFDKMDHGYQLVWVQDFSEKAPKMEVAYRFFLDSGSQPMKPAYHYRDLLHDTGQFKTLAEKAVETPAVLLLKGAPHAYIWGGDPVSPDDVARGRWQVLCQTMLKGVQEGSSPSLHLKATFTGEQWKAVVEAADLKNPYGYLQAAVAAGLSAAVVDPEFRSDFALQEVALAEEAVELLRRKDSLSTTETVLLNSYLLSAAFPDTFIPVKSWGGGASLQMLKEFGLAGLDHLKLCVDGQQGLHMRPWVAEFARRKNWLIGTYDSYHSVHSTTASEEQTWETAQMTQEVFDVGSVVGADGKFLTGFRGTGRKVNSEVVRPFVEKRVTNNFEAVPYNYYFVDCDATGEVFDDFAPGHLLGREGDAAARLSRLEWIASTFHAAVGSEGGHAFAASTIAVGEGVSGPFFGWDEPAMKDPNSKYYRGRYWPKDGPAVFFKPIPLMERFKKMYYEPSQKLPLYNAVFHDSVVAGPHWNNTMFKYPEVQAATALTDILYLTPPMYHFNLSEFATRKKQVMDLYKTWSPLHYEFGFHAMTAFEYLTEDHLVQRADYGPDCHIIVNFGDAIAHVANDDVPAMSAVVTAPTVWKEPRVYTPMK